MADRILYPEYRDALAPTKYPFSDSATLTARTGVTLPRDAILDASLYPPGDPTGCYLSKVTVSPAGIELVLGTPSNAAIATASIPAGIVPPTVAFTDRRNMPCGILVPNPDTFGGLFSWPQETHDFDRLATPFVASCLLPTPIFGVRSLVVDDQYLVGDVWLVGGDGVVLDLDDRDPENPRLLINCVGDALFLRRRCECDPSATLPWAIKTINGWPPDEYGNFFLVRGHHDAEDSILRITPLQDGLKISLAGAEEIQGEPQ